MPINQIITKPITLYSGSLVSSILPNGTNAALTIPSASLPAYTTSSFRYGFLQNPYASLSTTQAEISELKITLANSTRYLVVAHILGGSFSTSFGVRIGFNATSATTNIYNIETPNTTTATVLGVNQTATPTTSPSSTPSNVYCTIVRAIVTTLASGTPTVVPTYATSTGLGTVTIGPSFIYAFAY